MTRSYRDNLAPRVEAILQSIDPANVERVMFELNVLVTQPRPNSAAGLYAVLALTMPSTVLGQAQLTVQTFPAIGISDESLDRLVREGIAQLREANSAQLDVPRRGNGT